MNKNVEKDLTELENKISKISIVYNEDKKYLNIDYINDRINKEICYDTINKLKDLYLIDEYKKCRSVKNAINKLETILKNHNIEDKKKLIINDYLLELIPAGTKGVIRGNKFNTIVKNAINNLKLDNKRFEICFEKHYNSYIITERPDWYIKDKKTDKVIIGMNQLDLWNGGQQLNRGFKYLIDNKNNTGKSKLLCVICNEIKFVNNKKKVYKLFETGFHNNTLCYIKNLDTIINKYFN